MRSPAESRVDVCWLRGTISPLRSTAIRFPSRSSSRTRSAMVAAALRHTCGEPLTTSESISHYLDSHSLARTLSRHRMSEAPPGTVLLRVTAHRSAQQAQLRSKAGAGVAKQQVEPDAELTPERKTAVLHLREQ